MIRMENVSKIYNRNKENEFYALKDASLTIKDGEMVAIIGKSGAGKSTLMHLIGCIDSFEKGTYELNGQDVTKLGKAKKAAIRNSTIGIVMQDFALVEEYTAEENVMIPLYFSKNRKKRKERALNALELVSIRELAKKPVNQLSGGQKQRVAIARALVNEPDILLADEPTGALDTATGQEIVGVFKMINAMGKTVIIVTHDREVARQCNRIIEIKDGEICKSD